VWSRLLLGLLQQQVSNMVNIAQIEQAAMRMFLLSNGGNCDDLLESL
jgi:hypothetical protein